MAPALNEPMSPTEKLSNSTAKITPSSRANKVATDTDSPAQSPIITGCNDSTEHHTKEKRTRKYSVSTPTPTPSSSASIVTRVTRSKDAYQRVFEQAVSPTIPVTPSQTVKEATNTSADKKNNSDIASSTSDGGNDSNNKHLRQDGGKTSNEQMGLSVILHKKNNSCGDENVFLDADAIETSQKGVEPICNNNNNNNTSVSYKTNSTEQLLADLTNDIEESITTKVCIRKQLHDVSGDKDGANASNVVTSTTTEPKGSVSEVIESNAVVSPLTAEVPHIEQLEHMDIGLESVSGKSESIVTSITKAQAQKVTNVVEKKRLNDSVVITTASSNSTVILPTSSSEELHSDSEILHSSIQKPEGTTRLQILSVDVLPPISTDSTMTASEVEDNLEERLSQLDGTAMVCEDVNPVTATVGIGTISTTSPRTPTKQQTQQQQVQQLQLQLQQSPPTPLTQQAHQQTLIQSQHTFTPQSSTSSVNTLNSTNLPPAFMKESGAGELEDQDIEEVLKVLKGFDGSAGADTLCDLNVLFNEEYALNYEEVNSQPASSTAKPSPLKEMQCEIERNQQNMQRRIDFLLRRMRKVQSRYMSKHCSEEIAGLFEWTARISAGKGGTMNNASGILNTNTAISVIAARPPASNWAEEKNPVAATQMSSMLRRLEQSSIAQQLCMVSANSSQSVPNTQMSRKSKKALLQEMQTAASTSANLTTPLGSSGERKGEVVVPHYDINVSEEMAQVAGLLQTEMREVQMAMDSDATESSSGGESADEMVTYNNQIQQPLAIGKRAAWRYSRDRAAIAARWSWLLSQIADLEIKIRQHTELRQEVVRTKGVVVSGLEEQYATLHGGHLKSIEAVTINTTTTTSSVNGYKGNILANASGKFDGAESDATGLTGAARTRGFEPSLFRKRKLLQTQSLHTISKKAARPSNIKCGCQWPFNPCALCTGRIDPTAPRDPPDTMMMADRIALLDPCYHPVLSFREGVSSTLHLESVARMPEWQQRVMRCQVKSIAKSVWKAEREAERAAGHNTNKKYNEPVVKRRYTKKKDRLAAEEKNAAAAAASALASGTTTTNASTSAGASLAVDSSVCGAGTVASGGGSSGTSADASAPSSNAATTALTSTKLAAGDSGNVSAKNSKKAHHYHLVGDGVLLEPPRPLSPVPTNHSGHSQSSHHSQQSGNSNSNYIHQTSDNPPQNYDPYNPSPAHSSLTYSNSNGFNGGGVGGGNGSGIGNHKNNNKYRKSSASSGAAGIVNNNNNNINSSSSNNHPSSHHQTNNLPSYYTNNNGESNDANWDGFGTRSRTSSPTHGSTGGGKSNYHKYERSKNRTSYDIDNIVIPYSVAAATRVEILQCKEIPTPKWRVIDEDRACSAKSTIGGDISPPKAEPVGMGGKEIAGCENIREQKEPSIDGGTSTKPVDVTNELVVAKMEVVEEKITAAENATNDDSEKLNVDNEMSATVGGVAVLANTDSSLIEPTKISEQRNNNSIKQESVCDSTSTEPVTKKVKSEKNPNQNEENKEAGCKSIEDVVEAKLTNEDDELPHPKIISNPVTMLALKSATRLNRRSTVREEESTDFDAAVEELCPEDVTDESIMLRHERSLVEERRKFKTYLKFPWSTRSRANRRIDSRAESSGANTPDPTSPAPQTPSLGGGDQESIPSPLAPSTPLNPLDTISETVENGASNPPASATGVAANNTNSNDLNKRLERRRTTSMKKDRELERRSSTPDPKEIIPPYEPLPFPLTDEAFESLLKTMPAEFHYLDFDAKYLEDSTNSSSAVGGSKSSRQRGSWRSDIVAVGHKRGKLNSTTQNCDVTNTKRQRINNNGGIARKGANVGGGGRGRKRGNQARAKTNDEAENGVHVAEEDEDIEDDDDVDLMMLLAAEEDDDYDYPKHHLAPDDDDLFDGGTGNAGSGALNGVARNHLMDIEDEYDAYLGRRHRDGDAESSESEPFADDDPNDPEWRGESEDRGGGGGERNRRTAVR